MENLNRKLHYRQFIYNTLPSAGKNFFRILYSLFLRYLLGVDYVAQWFFNRNKTIPSNLLQVEDYQFPRDCPETITSALMYHLFPWTSPAGRISLLKRENSIQFLANWRDIFLKDMYFSTLTGFDRLKVHRNDKFILHKLEILKDQWSKIDPESIKRGGISKEIGHFYPWKLTKEKRKELWDWRLAYQRENPHLEKINTDIMDRVEREYPNYGDKVRLKPEYRNREAAESGVEATPNYITEAQFLHPQFWEGIVVSLRSPEDPMIRVHMLRIFKRDEDEDDDESVVNARLLIPTTFVEGLGPARPEDSNLIPSYYLKNPYYNLYGTFLDLPYGL